MSKRLGSGFRVICLASAGLLLAACGTGAHADSEHPETASRPARTVEHVTLPAERPVTVPSSPRLVPGTPIAMKLCRYRSMFLRHPFAGCLYVRKQSLLRGLLSELNLLPPGKGGEFACPSANGSRIDAYMDYAHQRTVLVRIGLSGCRSASRDEISRSAMGRAAGRLIGKLERLTGRGRA